MTANNHTMTASYFGAGVKIYQGTQVHFTSTPPDQKKSQVYLLSQNCLTSNLKQTLNKVDLAPKQQISSFTDRAFSSTTSCVPNLKSTHLQIILRPEKPQNINNVFVTTPHAS